MISRFLAGRPNNLVVIGLSVALGASLATQWRGPSAAQAQAAPDMRRPLTADQKAVLRSLQDAFATIAQNTEPFVVTVTARATAQERPSTGSRSQGSRAPGRRPRIVVPRDGEAPDFPFDLFRGQF